MMWGLLWYDVVQIRFGPDVVFVVVIMLPIQEVVIDLECGDRLRFWWLLCYRLRKQLQVKNVVTDLGCGGWSGTDGGSVDGLVQIQDVVLGLVLMQDVVSGLVQIQDVMLGMVKMQVSVDGLVQIQDVVVGLVRIQNVVVIMLPIQDVVTSLGCGVWFGTDLGCGGLSGSDSAYF